MAYSVKELFYTLQGEGRQAGRPSVFCRFAGCNLWSGREEDRASADCRFCDTDFIGTDGTGGGRFQTAKDLAEAAGALWPNDTPGTPYIVCTGGEPLLQLDASLIEAFHGTGFEVAVETNGTIAAPPGLDWVCVSPKAGNEMVLTSGDELKLIYPQAGLDPAVFEPMNFKHFLLQPMDGSFAHEADPGDTGANTAAAVRYCLENPRWRLSLQTHKMLGIP